MRKMHAKMATTPETLPPFFSPTELGERWRCHKRTAQRRMAEFGYRPVKLTERSILFRGADVISAEKLSAI
jgi:hypothetical protein